MAANFNARHDNEGGEYIDIIGLSYFIGWFAYIAELDVVNNTVLTQGRQMRSKYNKPIMMTEYGADAQEGLHMV
jgi:beta-glucuronidase